MASNLGVLVWNVRGLNSPARRNVVRLFIQSANTAIVCLQESKLETVDQNTVTQTLGAGFDGFDYLPADGTRGGVIIGWRSDMVTLSSFQKGEFTISANVRAMADDAQWYITSVYGPQLEADKVRFISELTTIGANVQLPWMLNGDFNLICDPADKNNHRINRRLMSRFQHALNSMALSEMPLAGRHFTWSSEQSRPTLVKLDRVFFSNSWDDLYPASQLQALSSSISDHCPMMLDCHAPFFCARQFRLETFWTRLEGFQDVVLAAWSSPVHSEDPYVVPVPTAR